MNIFKLLSAFLLGSAISLSVGGLLLYAYNQVPMFLINLTAGAVVVLFILAYFVSKGKTLAIDVSTVLGVFAPILSLSTPAHLAILESFGSSILVSADGLFQFLGFYAFPLAFVILRIGFRSKITSIKVKLPSGIETKQTETN